MKNLIFGILLLFSVLGYTQDVQSQQDLTSLEIVKKALYEKGEYFGVDLDSLLRTVEYEGFPVEYKGAMFSTTTDGLILGVTLRKPNASRKAYNANIYLNRELHEDLFLLEVVLAHEIGHILNLDHECCQCDEIMTQIQPTYVPDTDSYYLRYKNKPTAKVKWIIYFSKIKQKYKL